ncbi:hypothetical protein V8G54_037145 [Vigna mungo]|uniref:Uncharacterized protein n=1 Tax=Vigna mungo TaxID=3915 RepID=A0AAQ3RF44_VIGMU
MVTKTARMIIESNHKYACNYMKHGICDPLSSVFKELLAIETSDGRALKVDRRSSKCSRLKTGRTFLLVSKTRQILKAGRICCRLNGRLVVPSCSFSFRLLKAGRAVWLAWWSVGLGGRPGRLVGLVQYGIEGITRKKKKCAVLQRRTDTPQDGRALKVDGRSSKCSKLKTGRTFLLVSKTGQILKAERIHCRLNGRLVVPSCSHSVAQLNKNDRTVITISDACGVHIVQRAWMISLGGQPRRSAGVVQETVRYRRNYWKEEVCGVAVWGKIVATVVLLRKLNENVVKKQEYCNGVFPSVSVRSGGLWFKTLHDISKAGLTHLKMDGHLKWTDVAQNSPDQTDLESWTDSLWTERSSCCPKLFVLLPSSPGRAAVWLTWWSVGLGGRPGRSVGVAQYGIEGITGKKKKCAVLQRGERSCVWGTLDQNTPCYLYGRVNTAQLGRALKVDERSSKCSRLKTGRTFLLVVLLSQVVRSPSVFSKPGRQGRCQRHSDAQVNKNDRTITTRSDACGVHNVQRVITVYNLTIWSASVVRMVVGRLGWSAWVVDLEGRPGWPRRPYSIEGIIGKKKKCAVLQRGERSWKAGLTHLKMDGHLKWTDVAQNAPDQTDLESWTDSLWTERSSCCPKLFVLLPSSPSRAAVWLTWWLVGLGGRPGRSVGVAQYGIEGITGKKKKCVVLQRGERSWKGRLICLHKSHGLDEEFEGNVVKKEEYCNGVFPSVSVASGGLWIKTLHVIFMAGRTQLNMDGHLKWTDIAPNASDLTDLESRTESLCLRHSDAQVSKNDRKIITRSDACGVHNVQRVIIVYNLTIWSTSVVRMVVGRLGWRPCNIEGIIGKKKKCAVL